MTTKQDQNKASEAFSNNILAPSSLMSSSADPYLSAAVSSSSSQKNLNLPKNCAQNQDVVSNSGPSSAYSNNGNNSSPTPVDSTGKNTDDEKIIQISPNGVYAKVNNCIYLFLVKYILGKGSCKVVWKAINREEGVEVAWNCVKTSKAEYSELSQEIEILKKVRHPNIITFHDSWYSNTGEFVFITEMMTSGTLREYIKKIYPQLI